MTRNPNTDIADLQPASTARSTAKADPRTLGSLLAAGFILVCRSSSGISTSSRRSPGGAFAKPP